MITSKAEQPQDTLVIYGRMVKNVQMYKYLKTIVNENNNYTEEVWSRIYWHARKLFNNLRKTLCNRDLNKSLETRLLRYYYAFLPCFEAWKPGHSKRI